MIRVSNNEIIDISLPKTGTLKDGRSVSGYHLLDEDILKEEGWLPLEDIPPEYDEETQYLVNDGYEILEDKVIKKYKVQNIPDPPPKEPNAIEELTNYILDVDMRLTMRELGL